MSMTQLRWLKRISGIELVLPLLILCPCVAQAQTYTPYSYFQALTLTDMGRIQAKLSYLGIQNVATASLAFATASNPMNMDLFAPFERPGYSYSNDRGIRKSFSVTAAELKALIDRSVVERVSLVVEGVHIVPGYIEPSQFKDAWVVPLVITVDDEEAHRSHFYIREVQTDGNRPFEKYRENFGDIRLLGRYIEGLAKEHGTALIHSHQLDRTVSATLEYILSAVMGEQTQTGRAGASREKGAQTK